MRRSNEKWLNQNEIDQEATRQYEGVLNKRANDDLEQIAEIFVQSKATLVSAMKKRKEHKPMTDEEQAVWLDYQTRYDMSASAQQEAVDTENIRQQNDFKYWKKRDAAIRGDRKGALYE